MSRNPSHYRLHKTVTIRPGSVFPPASAAAIRRSAWQVTATLLAMLILLAMMAVLSPRPFPQMPPVAYPAELQEVGTLPNSLILGAAPGHHSVEQQGTALVTVKLWGAGILLLIGLRLLAATPRAPFSRPPSA